MMTLGALITKERMISGSCWQLCNAVNGFADQISNELVTQAAAGRSFQLVHTFPNELDLNNECFRLEVRLLEDGYRCWFDFSEIIGRAFCRGPWKPKLLTSHQIEQRIPKVLVWLDQAASCKNEYLWGGTIGPNFDCSGLVQAAFASEEIWLPRDAYQQENFCEVLKMSLDDFQNLRPGDLLFFGPSNKCTHVGIYKGRGMYCHSSGINNGRNGIGCDSLQLLENNSVSIHYYSQFRGAGRVSHCHDGMTLP